MNTLACFQFYIINFIFSVSSLMHTIKLGSCPEVECKKDFNFEKILGPWYVIQMTQTSSTCMVYNFSRSNDGEMKVTESAKPMGLSVPYIAEKFSQNGDLRVPSPNSPGKMRVTFTFSLIPFSEYDFWVMDSDYVSYLAIFSCRHLIGSHSQSAMILSRKTFLDLDKLNELRDKFDYFGINKHELTIVDQNGCDHEAFEDLSEESAGSK